MLHPALSQALATAHIEDLHRAATPRLPIRLQQGGPETSRESGWSPTVPGKASSARSSAAPVSESREPRTKS